MGARHVAPVIGALLVFVSGVALMIALLPGPLRPVDYFLCGAIGTLLALAAYFLTLIRISKAREMFYKKRPGQ